MKKHTGFTLLEILIALVIFAILGVLTAMSLHRTIKANKALNRQDKRVAQLQLAMTLMRRDLLQAIDRPIINASGGKSATFVGSGSSLQFTRAGLLNPFGVSRRTDMQRVSYQLSDSKLERLTWTVLDQSPKSQPLVQTLLSGVSSLTWSFVQANNKTANSWPAGSIDGKPVPLPKAVLLKMQVKGEGEIDGVFPVPAIGVVHATSTTS